MLHVWLRAQHSPLVVWHEEEQRWHSIEGWQQLSTIYSSQKTSSHKTMCLYFPSSHILQVDTELNSAQLKQLGNSGKQYLFEESSLTPVEQLTIRQFSHADSHQLYALAQSDIESWQQSTQLAGMTIAALVPDFLLLPPPEEGAGQQVTLYQDTQTMLLRQSSRRGMAVSYLPLIFERLSHLSEVMVLPPIAATSQTSNLLDNEAREPSNIDNHEEDNHEVDIPASAMGFVAQTAAIIAEHQLLLTPLSTAPKPIDHPERHALNFFVKSKDSQLSPYLRVAMMVALSALVLQMATDGVQWYQYNAATAATKTEIAAQYQAWFADEPLSMRTKLQIQLQPKLRRDSQASTSHMAALARISPLIKQSSLRAQMLVMQPSALSFTLIAPDRDSLDRFTSTLTAQGLSAKLAQVNASEQGQVSGQITVEVIENNDAPDNSALS